MQHSEKFVCLEYSEVELMIPQKDAFSAIFCDSSCFVKDKNGNGKTIFNSQWIPYIDLDKLPEALKKTTKKRLRTLNIAQVAGYLTASLVLGLGIPNLNIYITNTLDKKRKAAQAKLAEQKMSA